LRSHCSECGEEDEDGDCDGERENADGLMARCPVAPFKWMRRRERDQRKELKRLRPLAERFDSAAAVLDRCGERCPFGHRCGDCTDGSYNCIPEVQANLRGTTVEEERERFRGGGR
jgi:hypothetical protein